MADNGISSILSLLDDITRNNAKMYQSNAVDSQVSQRLLDELDRVYSYAKSLKEEAVRNRIAWSKEKEDLLHEMQHRQEGLQKEQNMRLATQDRLQQLQDVLDFACAVLTEAGVETDGGPPKTLSEKAVRQLWRVRSFKETVIGSKAASTLNALRQERLRASEASCPDSEDLDSENTDASGQPRPSYARFISGASGRTSHVRPRSNSIGLSGGECLAPGASSRGVHWGPGITSSSSIHMSETSAFPPPPPSLLTMQENTNAAVIPESSAGETSSDSASICSANRKRMSTDSDDSYFGISAKKKMLYDADQQEYHPGPSTPATMTLPCSGADSTPIGGSTRTLVATSASGSRLQRRHDLQVRNCTAVLQHCYACGKRFHFGKTTLKCRMCKAQLHPDCQELLAGPCLPPAKLTPSKATSSLHTTPVKGGSTQQMHLMGSQTPLSARSLRGGKGGANVNTATLDMNNSNICSTSAASPSSPSARRLLLEEMVPLEEAPKIPTLVIQCVSEIERRGLRQPGLYRVCGSDRQIREWYGKLMRGKLMVGLSAVEDVHCVTGCVKLFFRNLMEPLVSYGQWHRLRDIANTYFQEQQSASSANKRPLSRTVRPSAFNTVAGDGKCLLSYECIEEVDICLHNMPRANRDTLAYFLLHLQRVSESPSCNMHVENLCKVLGPTLVGHSAPVVSAMTAIQETDVQIQVMRLLLAVPKKFYEDILSRSVAAGPAEEDERMASSEDELENRMGATRESTRLMPQLLPTQTGGNCGTHRQTRRYFDQFHD